MYVLSVPHSLTLQLSSYQKYQPTTATTNTPTVVIIHYEHIEERDSHS